MKKIITAAALSLVVIFSSQSSNAQDLAGGISITPKSSRVVDPGTGVGYRVVDASEVNVRAFRDFNRGFANAQEVSWVQGQNGTSVYFTHRGIKMRSTYDRSGRREYTLKYYTESSMPATLRHLVKSHYYDFSIDQVTEINRNEATYYLVKMQNAQEHLTVKVFDGEIAPFERISKAN
jgi:hypothetical protein